MYQFKFGADPELFVKKNGVFVSGHGLIPGDKKSPYPVANGAVQVDGMALEFNIDPVDNEEDFIFNLDSVMSQLIKMVDGYEVVASPVADFTREYMDSQPVEAKELGCEPDYNAWSEEENPNPNVEVCFRTGSGHLHIGWEDGVDIEDMKHKKMSQAVVKQLDYYLGLPSLFFDNDTQRRELYGKAGAHRVKPYGVEYRVLSNKWLSSHSLMSWVFNNAKKALEDMFDGKFLPKDGGDIQEIINTSDMKKAEVLINRYGLGVPNV